MPKHFSTLLLGEEISRGLGNGILYILGAGVPGDVAEFGTMSGRTAQILAHFLLDVETVWRADQEKQGFAPRALHLFDSFEGLPAPASEVDRQSPHVQDGLWGEGLLRGLNAAELRQGVQQFLPPERVHIYEGFFAETLGQIPQQTRFALVHMDCDYYESTLQVLDHLFGKQMLNPGALLLFDDWNCNRASPEFGQRGAWQEILSRYDVSYSDQGSYSAFGHKFIVHNTAPRPTMPKA